MLLRAIIQNANADFGRNRRLDINSELYCAPGEATPAVSAYSDAYTYTLTQFELLSVSYEA